MDTLEFSMKKENHQMSMNQPDWANISENKHLNLKTNKQTNKQFQNVPVLSPPELNHVLKH